MATLTESNDKFKLYPAISNETQFEPGLEEITARPFLPDFVEANFQCVPLIVVLFELCWLALICQLGQKVILFRSKLTRKMVQNLVITRL